MALLATDHAPEGIVLTFLHSVVVKGTSNNLMKAGAKRRRSKAQIKEERQLESHRQREIVEKLSRIEQLE